MTVDELSVFQEILATDGRPIILLDLNYTLVENSKESMRGPSAHDVPKERYREWLVDLLRDRFVVLITARLDSYREETLAHIAKLAGWQPQEAWFKERRNQTAPNWKEEALLRFVFPRHGMPASVAQPEGRHYLALESNGETARMYARHGIPRFRQEEVHGQFKLLDFDG